MGAVARVWCWLLVAALLAVARPAAADDPNDRLDLIKARGTLVVGVKTDYPPFGFIGPNGEITGLETELAADLARRIGVELRLVSVTSANRLTRVEEGAVDVVIATMNDTGERRKLATLIEPNYYASGVNVMVPPNSSVDDWSDLRGQTVCATQGASFNKPMAERYLLTLQTYNGTRDPKQALANGRCLGWIYDEVFIGEELKDPDWAGYRLGAQTTLLARWAIAVSRAEAGGRLERLVGDAIGEWHRSGLLTELERKWGVSPSPFVAEANTLWNAVDEDGQPVCRRGADGAWAPECRNPTLLTSSDVTGLMEVGLRIKEMTGLDFSMIYDSYDRDLFFGGLGITVLLIAVTLAGSAALGLGVALVAEARIPLVSPFAIAVNTFFRLTPPLLQIYVVFLGIGALTVQHLGFTLNAFAVAVFCLSCYAGAATVVAWRSAADALRATDPGFRLTAATIPAALPLAYGGLVAALVNIVKATGMASTIAVPEVISASTAIIAVQGNANVIMNALMIIYFLLVMLTMRMFDAIKDRVVRHGRA